MKAVRAGARSGKQTVLVRGLDPTIQVSGYAPPDPSECAIIISCSVGNTTAVVRGKNNTTGNALVEAHILPP